MIYEFQCDQGHVTEASVPMGTKLVVCRPCQELMKLSPPARDSNGQPMCSNLAPIAWRILSPTRTTFVFADTHRKHRR